MDKLSVSISDNENISIETTQWSCIHSGYCASVSQYQGINPYCQGDNTIRVFDPFFLTFNSISFYFQILSSESISSGVVQTPVTLRHGSAVHSSIRYILALDAAHNHQAAPLRANPARKLGLDDLAAGAGQSCYSGCSSRGCTLTYRDIT
jgi:hypothetical protein